SPGRPSRGARSERRGPPDRGSPDRGGGTAAGNPCRHSKRPAAIRHTVPGGSVVPASQKRGRPSRWDGRDGERARFPRVANFAMAPPRAQPAPFSRVSLLPRPRRSLFAFLHDVAMAALSFALALYLRLGDAASQYEPSLMVIYGGVFTAI